MVVTTETERKQVDLERRARAGYEAHCVLTNVTAAWDLLGEIERDVWRGVRDAVMAPGSA